MHLIAAKHYHIIVVSELNKTWQSTDLEAPKIAKKFFSLLTEFFPQICWAMAGSISAISQTWTTWQVCRRALCLTPMRTHLARPAPRRITIPVGVGTIAMCWPWKWSSNWLMVGDIINCCQRDKIVPKSITTIIFKRMKVDCTYVYSRIKPWKWSNCKPSVSNGRSIQTNSRKIS